MTAPSAPQAAIDRLRRTLPGLRQGVYATAIQQVYAEKTFIDGARAFVVDIETLIANEEYWSMPG